MKHRLYRMFLFPAICFAITIILFRCAFLIGIVPTASMEPTIPAGAVVLGNRTAYWFSEPQVGDIVIFRHDAKTLIKRVAATAGQTIMHHGVALIVPDGCVYLLGDCPEASVDARFWPNPFVSCHLVLAKFLFKF